MVNEHLQTTQKDQYASEESAIRRCTPNISARVTYSVPCNMWILDFIDNDGKRIDREAELGGLGVDIGCGPSRRVTPHGGAPHRTVLWELDTMLRTEIRDAKNQTICGIVFDQYGSDLSNRVLRWD